MDPQFRVFVAGVMFAAFSVCVLAVWSRRVGRALRWAITLFCGGGAISRLGQVIPLALPHLPWDSRFVFVATAGHWALFLLLVQVMFDERKLKPLMFAPAVAMIGVAAAMLIADIAGDAPVMQAAGELLQVGDVVAIGWAMVVIARSWRGDVVAQRRRMRWAVFAVGAAYALVFGLAWFPIRYGWIDGAPIRALNEWMNLALMVAAAAAVLEIRGDLDRSTAPASGSTGFSEASRLALIRLHAVMGSGEAWRRPGLTIEALARETGVSERQLRRLINERLGHTNFAGFLNSYRIEAARTQLADPALAKQTIAEIASGLGYASIATFNRAFKDATGQTPGAWRKASAAAASGPHLAETA